MAQRLMKLKTIPCQWEQNQGAKPQRPPMRLIEEQVNDEQANCFSINVQADEINEPKSIRDAWNGEHSIEWKDATFAEYESLIKNKT